jgi:uncharacterized protein involved in high-affinity Fe2+ transport
MFRNLSGRYRNFLDGTKQIGKKKKKQSITAAGATVCILRLILAIYQQPDSNNMYIYIDENMPVGLLWQPFEVNIHFWQSAQWMTRA